MVNQMARTVGTDQVDRAGDRPWLRGIVPPVATPLLPDGGVDEVSLERQLRRLLDAGVHGLFVLGTSGEGAYLDAEDRRRVLEVTSQVVDGQVPVLAGAMCASARQAVEVDQACEGLGVTALVCTTPFYGAAHPSEIEDHFRSIAASVTLPVVAYNIPGATGTLLTVPMIRELALDGVIVGVKDSGGDEYSLRRTIAACKDLAWFPVMSGSEVMVDSALRLGAAGAVPGLGNVAPRPYVELYEASLAGDHARASRIQDSLIDLFAMAGFAASRVGNFSSGIGSFKTALVELGVFERRSMVSPLITLTDDEAAGVAEHLKRFDLERIC